MRCFLDEQERRIAIVGSREGINRERVQEFVGMLDPTTTVVISGGARGVDSWAVEAAKERDIRVRVYPAHWKVHAECNCRNKSGGSICKYAGFRRNKVMIDAADDVVAFWDGKSSGTAHSIEYAIEQRKPVAIFSPHGNLVRFIDDDGTVWEQNEREN